MLARIEEGVKEVGSADCLTCPTRTGSIATSACADSFLYIVAQLAKRTNPT